MNTVKLKSNIMELICRICLKICKKKINMFGSRQNDKLVSTIISECVPIKIKRDDGFPVNICMNCSEKLHVVSEFVQLAKESDEKLHNFHHNKVIEMNRRNWHDRAEEELTDDVAEVIDSTPAFDYAARNSRGATKEENLNNNNNETCIVESLSEDSRESSIETSSSPHSSYMSENEEGQRNNAGTQGVGIKRKMLVSKSNVTTTAFKKNKLFRWSNLDKNITERQTMLLKCSKCGQRFSSRCLLNQHTRTHAKSKDFKCEQCGKAFYTLYLLRMHMRAHSDARPYRYETCGKGLKSSTTLRKHLEAHKDRRIHVCDVCGRAFVQKYYLIRHQITHNTPKELKFACKTCHKKILAERRLKRHVRTYSKDRPHACERCPMRFLTKHTLHTAFFDTHEGEAVQLQGVREGVPAEVADEEPHARLHGGETPFSCELCSSAFKYKHNLLKHVARVHEKGENSPKERDGNV